MKYSGFIGTGVVVALACGTLICCGQSPSAGRGNPSQRQFADTVAELFRLNNEMRSLSTLPPDPPEGDQARPWFMDRFHELYDLEAGLDEQGDLLARHAEALRRIAAARPDGPAGRLTAADIKAVAAELFVNCREGACERGFGGVPPAVGDKVAACANFMAWWFEHVTKPRLRQQELQGRLDELSEKLDGSDPAAILGVAPGKDGVPVDVFDRTIEVVAKYHPQAVEAMRDFTIKRRSQTVTSAQRDVRRCLLEIRAAEEFFRDKHVYPAAPRGYWVEDLSGLYRLLLDQCPVPIGLIDSGLAARDSAALSDRPSLAALPGGDPWRMSSVEISYAYRSVKLDRDGNTLAGPLARGVCPDRFAFCAYPLFYGHGGRQTYLIDQSGKILFKDTDGKPVERLPADAAAEGWTEAELFDAPPESRSEFRFAATNIRSSDPEARRQALISLRENRPFGSLVGDLFIKLMADRDDNVRAEAFGSVSWVLERHWAEAKSLFPKVLAASHDSSTGVVGGVIHALGVVAAGHLAEPEGLAAADALVNLLQAGVQENRSSILYEMGQAFGKSSGGAAKKATAAVPDQAVRAIANLLGDADSDLAGTALTTLEQLGPAAKPAGAQLCRYLDAHPERGGYIVPVLRDANPDPVIVAPSLEKLVRTRLATDDNTDMRALVGGPEAALRYLGQLGQAAVPALVRIVADRSPYSPAAARQLGRIGPAAKPATDVLTAAMRDPANRDLCRQAAYARWRITADAAATIDLLRRQTDGMPEDADQAVELLGRMGPAAAGCLADLRKLLEKADAEGDLAKALKLAMARVQWPGILKWKKP